MKKIVLITIIAFILIFSITGCGKKEEQKEKNKTEEKIVLKLQKFDFDLEEDEEYENSMIIKNENINISGIKFENIDKDMLNEHEEKYSKVIDYIKSKYANFDSSKWNIIVNIFAVNDGNGIINENDKYFYKKADADVVMGLSSKLTYKNWDLGFSLRASLNNYMYNSIEANDRADVSPAYVYSNSTWHNVIEYQLAKNWQHISAVSSQSDYFIQNASFLKCDNITLGYSFDHIGKSKINGRVYATAQNVFTITKYKGIDPEVSGGYDGAIYPRPFIGILGVNLNF